MSQDLSFIHRFEPGADANAHPVLLLHGTGGDENDLIPLGHVIAPNAPLLSPRGKVLENGMTRYFRRVAGGVFDEDDVRRRAIWITPQSCNNLAPTRREIVLERREVEASGPGMDEAAARRCLYCRDILTRKTQKWYCSYWCAAMGRIWFEARPAFKSRSNLKQ